MTIRIGRFSFEPGLVPTAAAGALIALTLWLGNWQLGRADEKRERQGLLEARLNDTPVRLAGAGPTAQSLMYRRVRATGRWMADRQFFIDNQIRNGHAGFHVITPLAIEGGSAAVLVNRGWIPRSVDYPRAPTVVVPEGVVEVAGTASRPPARYLELSKDQVSGDVWQNLSIERYAAASGLALLPVVVLQDPASPALAAVREVPDAGIAKHMEYAFTWFSLAATAFTLWIVLNVKRRPA
jgi:surfeit locus 1 family protein